MLIIRLLRAGENRTEVLTLRSQKGAHGDGNIFISIAFISLVGRQHMVVESGTEVLGSIFLPRFYPCVRAIACERRSNFGESREGLEL
jgi:hypothetical protein